MWNKVVETLQEKSTKRLGLAVLISASLHVFLVSGFHYKLPSLKQEMHTIEARLLMPKVVIKNVASQKLADNQPVSKVESSSKVTPEPIKTLENTEIEQAANEQGESIEPLPAVTETNAEVEPVIEAPAIAQADVKLGIAAQLDTTAQTNKALEAEGQEASADNQPVDMGLVANENAYQYVETEFDVRTQIDGSARGKAVIRYDLLGGQQYKLVSLIKPLGLAALIVSDATQKSEGVITKNGLQPSQYSYQYGSKADKSYSAKFDWLNKKLSLITAKGTKIEDLPDGTQDLLSFMYQFMHVAPLQQMQISIATGKKLATYDYSFEGEESIITPMGELKTVHIFHATGESDDKTELWLAVDYQYLPVKIRQTKGDGKTYELVAMRIKTTRTAETN